MKLGLHLTASLVIAASLLIKTQTAQASDISFTPRASVSLTSYKFSQTARVGALANTGINNNDFPEIAFDVAFKIIGLGGIFFKDGYYLELSAQNSADEEGSFTLNDPLFSQPFVETFKGDHQDTAITFGKKILDNRDGIYIGYKTGKSEASGNQCQHLSFEEKGLFIVANYGWTLADKGTLSVNIALADLNGDLTEDVTNPIFASGTGPNDIAVPLDINATRDAKGLSVGVSWSSRLTDYLSYSVTLDAKKYTFDNVKDSNLDTIYFKRI